MNPFPRLAALCLLYGLTGACHAPEVPATAPLVRETQILHPPSLSPEIPLPLVIALHGLGDTPEKFLTLFKSPPLNARVIALEGWRPYHSGYTWFPFPSSGADRESQLHLAIQKSATRVRDTIVELTRRFPTLGLPIVTGFSQGGMLSFYLALQHPDILSAALPIAGSFSNLAVTNTSIQSVPIVAFHGKSDARVPYETTHTNITRLKERGLNVKLYTYPSLGHRVSTDEFKDWRRELSAAVARTTP